MRVAIKFCGGCDPAYDRVEFFQRVRAAAADRVEWVRLGDERCQAVLLICGCLRACPEDELPQISRLLTLKHNGLPPDQVVALVLEKGANYADHYEG